MPRGHPCTGSSSPSEYMRGNVHVALIAGGFAVYADLLRFLHGLLSPHHRRFDMASPHSIPTGENINTSDIKIKRSWE